MGGTHCKSPPTALTKATTDQTRDQYEPEPDSDEDSEDDFDEEEEERRREEENEDYEDGPPSGKRKSLSDGEREPGKRPRVDNEVCVQLAL
jgi:hypothetical protein